MNPSVRTFLLLLAWTSSARAVDMTDVAAFDHIFVGSIMRVVDSSSATCVFDMKSIIVLKGRSGARVRIKTSASRSCIQIAQASLHYLVFVPDKSVSGVPGGFDDWLPLHGLPRQAHLLHDWPKIGAASRLFLVVHEPRVLFRAEHYALDAATFPLFLDEIEYRREASRVARIWPMVAGDLCILLAARGACRPCGLRALAAHPDREALLARLPTLGQLEFLALFRSHLARLSQEEALMKSGGSIPHIPWRREHLILLACSGDPHVSALAWRRLQREYPAVTGPCGACPGTEETDRP